MTSRRYVLTALLLLVAGCSSNTSVNEPEPETSIETPESIQGQWRLLSVDGEAIEVSVNTESVPLLTIDETSVSGDFGCNSGESTLIVLPDGRLQGERFESTMELCSIPDGSTEMVLSERALSSLLESQDGFDVAVEDNFMVWRNTDYEAEFDRG